MDIVQVNVIGPKTLQRPRKLFLDIYRGSIDQQAILSHANTELGSQKNLAALSCLLEPLTDEVLRITVDIGCVCGGSLDKKRGALG